MSTNNNVKVFKRIDQYTKEQFNKIEQKETGVMYLVREKTDPNNPGEVEIWFGNRMYATNKKEDISCGTF